MKFMFLSGWQRSGTTLVTRALDAHPNITMVSDPLLPLFKMGRNKFFKDHLGVPIKKDAPISDDFLVNKEIKKKLRENISEVFFTEEDLELLKVKLKKFNGTWKEQHAPLIIPYLEELKPGNFKNILKQFISFIKDAYGDKNTKVIGFKQTYCEQFMNNIIENYESYSSIVIRDPRGAFASRNCKGKYLNRAGSKLSTLFITRNWRKSVAYHLKYKSKDNYEGILYESFVKNPTHYLKRFCNMLNLDFSEKMIDFNYYTGGTGDKWISNSSYDSKKGFSTSSINKWENKLNNETIKAIEVLCKPEMNYLEYSLEFKNADIIEVLINYNEDKEKIRDWEEEYGYVINKEEIKKEITRDYFLTNKQVNYDSELLDRFFIFKTVYNKLKNI